MQRFVCVDKCIVVVCRLLGCTKARSDLTIVKHMRPLHLVVCADVNECLENNGGCDSKRKCTNNNGGRVCGKCSSGWENDGATGCKGL